MPPGRSKTANFFIHSYVGTRTKEKEEGNCCLSEHFYQNDRLTEKEKEVLRDHLVEYFVAHPVPNSFEIPAEELVRQIVPVIAKRPQFRKTVFHKLTDEDLHSNCTINDSMEKVIKEAIYDREALDEDVSAAKKKAKKAFTAKKIVEKKGKMVKKTGKLTTLKKRQTKQAKKIFAKKTLLSRLENDIEGRADANETTA